MTKEYSSNDIQVLSDRDHVRQRTQIYLGNMNKTEYVIPSFINGMFNTKQVQFVPAVFKSVGEILDNSIDELAQLNKRNKLITIQAEPENGTYLIRDNGRGIPIDKHETGKHTPEVALGSLRAGRNFGETQAGVIGQNGVGSACVNYCSTEFNIKINRDKKVYTQKFSDGTDKITRPKIQSTTTTKTGTEVSFTLDGSVFTNGVDLPEDMVHNRAMEVAFNNPGMTVQYGDYIYKFNNGLDDLVKKISKNYFKFSMGDMEFYVVFDIHEGIDEQVFTWVNSSLLFDGGLCNTQFMNAFCDKVASAVATQAKKQKCTVTKNDVRQNLLVFGVLKVAKPEYDAQSKTRLTGPNLRKEINDLLDEQWKAFSRNNKDWFAEVVERAAKRHHKNANSKAAKEFARPSKAKVIGLTDATSRSREKCKLIVTEGLSASSMITEVRDPEFVGSYPLTGKINNVFHATAADILKMPKLTNLLKSLGLVPGKTARIPELRFGKLYIATDADPDGDDIMTLIVCLLFSMWPELFDPSKEPFVYRLVAPNVVLSKGSKRVHFSNRRDYESKKGKYKGWTSEYFKGLGSMWKEDWEMILNEQSDTLIPIQDTDGSMQTTLNLLFNDNLADARKEWLKDEDE